jgi:hypothetical protein
MELEIDRDECDQRSHHQHEGETCPPHDVPNGYDGSTLQNTLNSSRSLLSSLVVPRDAKRNCHPNRFDTLSLKHSDTLLRLPLQWLSSNTGFERWKAPFGSDISLVFKGVIDANVMKWIMFIANGNGNTRIRLLQASMVVY